MLENRVLLRSTQIRLAGLQDNRTRFAVQRGKSKRQGSAPRHLRSALTSGYKSLSFCCMASERYVFKSWVLDTCIYFLVLDTSACPYVSAIRCATTVCIYTVWGHFGEHQRMQPLGHMCYRRQFQNKVTATYHWLDRGRSSGKKLLVQSSKCLLM